MSHEPPSDTGVSKPGNFFPLALLIILVLIVPVFFFGSFLVVPALTIFRADEGFKHARRTIDPEKLRAWALEEINKNPPGTNSFYHSVPESEIPDYINNLYSISPEDVMVSPNTSDSDGFVEISWGGGFFHWAIQIGNTNLTRPFKSDNGEHPYNFQWTNGIYYTREAAWRLL
jgi:hypothetical protein